MSDTIFVTGLVLHAYHGVMPHEAKVGQPFKLDLVLDIDLGEAARTDSLKHTVSYDALTKTAPGVTSSSRPPPAASPRRCSPTTRKSAASASRCTSRMRRSPRPSTMSASASSASVSAPEVEAFIALGGNVGDVRATFDRAVAAVAYPAPQAEALARPARRGPEEHALHAARNHVSAE